MEMEVQSRHHTGKPTDTAAHENDDHNDEELISGSNFTWSPNGHCFAFSVKHWIVVQNAKTLRPQCSYSIGGGVEQIDSLQWSADSLYLAAVSVSKGLVYVRRLNVSSWKCRIDMGDANLGVGLMEFQWSPDARHLLITAAHFAQLTIWSLSKSIITSFNNLCPIEKYKSFSSGGKFLAVAHCDLDLNTCVCIYDSAGWDVQERFAVISKDLIGIEWCPNDSSILLWDSPLFSNLYIYSTKGELLKHYSPDGLSLGILSIQWSPLGHLLALTNHRNKLRILNGLTFGLLIGEEMEFTYSQHLIHKDCKVYYEILTEEDGVVTPKYELDKSWSWTTSMGNGSLSKSDSSLAEESIVHKMSIQFCPLGNYVACRTGTFQNQLWIWDLRKVVLIAVLVQIHPISDFAWDPDPSHERLVLCTGGHHLYFWAPERQSYTRSIKSYIFEDGNKTFKAQRISWNKQGISFAVQDTESNRVILALFNSKNNM